MRSAFLLLLLLDQSAVPAASPPGRRIDAALVSSPGAARAYWGIHVVDASTGRVLYDRNADHFFVPASNTKLFSTALALSRLGPDYRFRTLVLAAAPPDTNGILRGDLRLAGSGDPTLSGRAYPYQKSAPAGDPLAAINSFADQLVSRGITEVNGDIIGDDTAFPWEPYPEGWAEGDTIWSYGAPVSALTLNDNTLVLRIFPPGRVAVEPPVEYYTIDNRIGTGSAAGRRIRIARQGRQLLLSGSMQTRDSGTTEFLAIDDPALYAAQALKQALEARGVVVRGAATALHRAPGQPQPAAGGVVLAQRDSPPLSQVLQLIDKISQNLHAELVLREVARVRRGDAARDTALKELRDFLAEAGLDAKDTNFEDASGLSRLTLVTPAALTRLLLFMNRSPHRDVWFGLLPVGGEDGTLSSRFANAKSARRIHAKTGSLGHVAALAGYADSPSGRRVAFSIVANNYNAPPSEIRAVIDRIALVLAE